MADAIKLLPLTPDEEAALVWGINTILPALTFTHPPDEAAAIIVANQKRNLENVKSKLTK